ncbi:MAG TPA: helix-turn-helix domain-containing protein [Candidatus Binataceae bacterium]|jgi:excisionase family DNA binding protein|nr:helix-turn-helix domain-containing protein [Candidatus Binataceae bacterium]
MGTESTVMTLKELAAYLRVNPTTIYRLAKRKQIPGFKIGADWRFHREAIDEWRHRQETNVG